MPQVVPGWASLLIFLLVLFLIGVMEGIQVVHLSLAFPFREPPRLPWSNSSFKTQPRTRQATQRLTGGLRAETPFKCDSSLLLRLGQIAAKGDNIERFLMGRQVFITVFVLHPCVRSLLCALSSLLQSWLQSTGDHRMDFSSQFQKLFRWLRSLKRCQRSSIFRHCCWRPDCWPALLWWLWPSSHPRLLPVFTRSVFEACWDIQSDISWCVRMNIIPRLSSCKQWLVCPPTTPASPLRQPGSPTSPGSSPTSPAEPAGSIRTPAGPWKRTTTKMERRTNQWRMLCRSQPFNHMTLEVLYILECNYCTAIHQSNWFSALFYLFFLFYLFVLLFLSCSNFFSLVLIFSLSMFLSSTLLFSYFLFLCLSFSLLF